MTTPYLSGSLPDLEASGQAASDAVARAAAALVSPAGYACEPPAISDQYWLLSKRAALREAVADVRRTYAPADRGSERAAYLQTRLEKLEAEHRTLTMKYSEQAMDLIRLELQNKTLRTENARLRDEAGAARAAVIPAGSPDASPRTFPAAALRHGLKVGG